jgi:hypothetical protein
MIDDFFGAGIGGDWWHRQQCDSRKNHNQPPEFHAERVQDESANSQSEKNIDRSKLSSWASRALNFFETSGASSG